MISPDGELVCRHCDAARNFDDVLAAQRKSRRNQTLFAIGAVVAVAVVYLLAPRDARRSMAGVFAVLAFLSFFLGARFAVARNMTEDISLATLVKARLGLLLAGVVFAIAAWAMAAGS